MRQRDVIRSSSNGQVKNLVSLLKKAKTRKEQDVFVIEGIKMFEEAKLGNVLEKTYASESFHREIVQTNPNYFDEVEYEIIADSLFNEIAETKTPQGILATVKMPEYSLSNILQEEKACLLLLEDIRDPGNLGTMIRTAEGAGVTGVILNSSSVDLFNPKVIRSTMGSIFRVPFYVAEDFLATLALIKQNNIEIFAAHLMGKTYDIEGSFQKKCAFLIGNEANGLSEEISKMADTRIKIPMEGKVESLNAAVAAAILMYEAARQRRGM